MLATADVLAQEAAGGSNFMFIIMIVGFIALMYFVMIRPQKKKQREQQDMQNTVAPGARVMTIGGLYGTVVDADDETVTLEASDETFLVFARQAVAKVVTPAETEADVTEEEATLSDDDLDKLRGAEADADGTAEETKDKHSGKQDRKEY